MSEIRSLDQAQHFLLEYARPPEDKPYTLHRMRQLMKLLGNPQNKLQIIHVAGTSGKTSTCYYISRLLSTTGLRVGLSVSPHVKSLNERVQINNRPLSEEQYCAYLTTFLELVRKANLQPSYFELLVAFAFWVLEQERVDIAIIEVGLGGLLDCTNVIDNSSKTCVITDIGLDHTEILGKTLSAITRQKAGIIQDSNQVFMNRQTTSVMQAVQAQCEQRNAHLSVVSRQLTLPGLADFQLRNLSLAFAVVNDTLTKKNLPSVTREDATAVSRQSIPGRLEVFSQHNKEIVLDGAHNHQKIQALVQALKSTAPHPSTALLVSFGTNKLIHITPALQELHKIADHIVITKFTLSANVRRQALTTDTLANQCRSVGFKSVTVQPDPAKAFHELLDSDYHRIVVTGSFFLLNHIRPLLMKK